MSSEDWKIPYSTCVVCDKSLNEDLYQWALKRHELMACGIECSAKNLINRMACCEQAKIHPCVCAYSFECPIHGIMHIGTHD